MDQIVSGAGAKGSSETLLPWYVLRVRTKAELLVEKALKAKGYDLFCPTYTEARQYSDRIQKTEVALFGGYVFCRLDVSNRLPVLVTPGVQGIVGFGGLPVPLAEQDIDNIRRALQSGGKVRPWPYLKTGQRIRVICGALTGVEGILLNTKGADQVVLSIDILQRSVTVGIERSWIEPIL
jgi:transcription antitermination factor NusG